MSSAIFMVSMSTNVMTTPSVRLSCVRYGRILRRYRLPAWERTSFSTGVSERLTFWIDESPKSLASDPPST